MNDGGPEARMNTLNNEYWFGVTGAGAVGFALGALTTYQVACALRPRR